MKLKQLFCNHIWETKKTYKVRESREPYVSQNSITYYADYIYYAEDQECIICNRKRTIEKRTWSV